MGGYKSWYTDFGTARTGGVYLERPRGKVKFHSVEEANLACGIAVEKPMRKPLPPQFQEVA